MTTPQVLGRSSRTPIPYADGHGIPCFRVPLDDDGREYAQIEQADYDRITREIGCRAAWYPTPNGGGRRYPAVNVPRVDGQTIGLTTIARLFMDVGHGERVCFVTDDTFDLRRSNLQISGGGSRTRDKCDQLVADAVKRQQAVKLKKNDAAA